MSITYEFREDICFIISKNKVSKVELDKYFKKISKDPAYKTCVGILLHDISSFYIPSVSDIKSTALGFRQSLGQFEGKIALVVKSNVKYGLGRMLESLSSDIDMRVFKSMDMAVEWLS